MSTPQTPSTVSFIQAQPFVLQGAGASIGDVTITLQSMVGIDGNNILTADLGSFAYGTLEPGNGTQEEAIIFTGITQNANGTATLTGVSSIGFKQPYTITSGLQKTHAGNSKFVLSNDAAFYNNLILYLNSIAGAGAANASTAVKGIVQQATLAQFNSGVPTGSTGAILVVTPDVFAQSAYALASGSVATSPIASDGSDGAVTINSGTTTLTRDMYYTTLTVNNTGILKTNGYRVFANTSVTVDGTSGAKIHNDGTAGSGATGGAGGGAGTLPGGLTGGNGGAGVTNTVGNAGTNGTAATAAINTVSGSAGGGGNTGGAGQLGGSGGVGGVVSSSAVNVPRSLISAYNLFDFTSGTAVQRQSPNAGSAGGGSGGCANTGAASSSGGGGGGSGGVVFISTRTIGMTGAGCISANGGAGATPANSAGNSAGGSGGGGGGNGGVVLLSYLTKTGAGTATASGGAAGAGSLNAGGGGNGFAGTAGTAGLVIALTQ